MKECRSRNIKIGYTPYENSGCIAEFTKGFLLGISRRIFESLTYSKDKNLPTLVDNLHWISGKGLQNSTVGIFGLGNIGLIDF